MCQEDVKIEVAYILMIQQYNAHLCVMESIVLHSPTMSGILVIGTIHQGNTATNTERNHNFGIIKLQIWLRTE